MATDVETRYCPICGQPVVKGTYNRFGEWCCSEAHAEQYVTEVRSQKQRQLVNADTGSGSRQGRHRGGCC